MAFYATYNHDNSYLDVTVCFCVNRRIANFHVLAVKYYESQTGQSMFEFISEILQALIVESSSKRF